MSDTLSQTQRSYNMSLIRGKNTKPEILVRKELHARGFRFRLHNKKLPGSPDIVLPKYGVVIMINGCFWHGHRGCKYATKPKSNVEFWEVKIARNRHRDEVTEAHLQALGWNVVTIWDCELKGKSIATSRLDELVKEIRLAGVALHDRKKSFKSNRIENRRKTKELMARQSQLEKEISELYPLFSDNLKVIYNEIQASLEKYSEDAWWVNDRNVETHLDIDGLYESRQEEIIEGKVIMESMELVNILLRVHDFITKLHGSYYETLVQQYLRQQVESSKI